MMNISINESTIDALRKSMEDKKKNAARIVIKGFGWGGPTLGLVLDEQKENDEIIESNGIKFVADKEFAFMLTDVKVNFKKGLFGSTFSISTATGSGC